MASGNRCPRRMSRTRGWHIAVALICCCQPLTAQAQDSEETAVSLATSAGVLAKDGDFDGAVRLYQKAYDLAREPVLLYNIARMHDRKGDLEKARDVYVRYLAEETDPEGLSVGKEKLEAVLDRWPGRLVVTSTPTGAKVQVDGKPAGRTPAGPMEIGRGTYQVRIALEGHESVSKSVTVIAGEAQVIEVALKAVASASIVPAAPVPVTTRAAVASGPASPARSATTNVTRPASGSRSPWPWVCIGTGAAVAATGGVMTFLAFRERSKVTDAATREGYVTGMSRTEALSHRSTAGTYDKVGYALYAAGGAAIVTGVVLWFVLPKKLRAATAESPALLTVAPGPGGGLVGATGRF